MTFWAGGSKFELGLQPGETEGLLVNGAGGPAPAGEFAFDPGLVGVVGGVPWRYGNGSGTACGGSGWGVAA